MSNFLEKLKENKMARSFILAVALMIAGFLFGFYAGYLAGEYDAIKSGKVESMRSDVMKQFSLDFEKQFEKEFRKALEDSNAVIDDAFWKSFNQIAPFTGENAQKLVSLMELNKKVDLNLVYQALIIGSNTYDRARAAQYLGTHGNKESIPYLIAALSDESTHVGGDYPDAGMATTRYWANDSLKKLTGKDFGFVWNDPIEKRNAAIRRWKLWYLESIKE